MLCSLIFKLNSFMFLKPAKEWVFFSLLIQMLHLKLNKPQNYRGNQPQKSEPLYCVYFWIKLMYFQPHYGNNNKKAYREDCTKREKKTFANLNFKLVFLIKGKLESTSPLVCYHFQEQKCFLCVNWNFRSHPECNWNGHVLSFYAHSNLMIINSPLGILPTNWICLSEKQKINPSPHSEQYNLFYISLTFSIVTQQMPLPEDSQYPKHSQYWTVSHLKLL